MVAEFILVLALLILLAKILAEIAEKIGFPSLVGEVTAGILLGPEVLNLLGHSTEFSELAEIGIILLIFLAGFEHGNLSDLLKYKNTSILISVLSSSMPIIAVIIFAMSQGFTLLTSLFLAVALGATSMGVSLRSLMGVDEINSRVGKTVIGSLVLNDITGLILLTIVVTYSEVATGAGTNIGFELLKVLMSIGMFFGLFYLSFLYFPNFTKVFTKLKVEEAQFSIAIITVLIAAWGANYFGLSSIIGAFFAGVVLSKSAVFENHIFMEKISSISYGFFVPIFFTVTGSRLSFANFGSSFQMALIFIGLIATVQIGCAFIATKINKYSNKEGVLVGLGMLPYGEVTLVVMSALIALSQKKPEFFTGQDVTGLFSSVLLVIMFSIVATPVLMKLVKKVSF